MAQASSQVQVVVNNEEENDRLAEQQVLAPLGLSGTAVRVLDSGASDGELPVHTLKSFPARTNNRT